MPTGTGKLFKGLKPIFAEQAVKGEFGVEGINEQLTHLVKPDAHDKGSYESEGEATPRAPPSYKRKVSLAS